MSTEVERAVAEKFQDGDAEVVNGNELFARDSVENAPVKDTRVFKKAKRTIRLSPRKSESEEEGSTSPGVLVNGTASLLTKNSRKSRDGRGRGLPKKGGAGGKGTWGKLGSELYETAECKDANDPNYDSDNTENCRIEKVVPILKDEELVRTLLPILREYMEHGDSNEVKTLVSALNIDDQQHKIAEMAVSLALDRHDPHRELTSRLLSDLHGGDVINQKQLERSFDELLNNLQDLTLDTPDAPTLLGQFIARAVADDCVSSDFVSKYKGKVDSTIIKLSLEKAEVLLEMNQSIVNLDQVWGQGGGSRPVKYLTNKMVLLLQEYLDSNDGNEAIRCVRDLDVPHFHHELVYQAALLAIEHSTERAAERITQVLKLLTVTNIITPDEFAKGVRRVYKDMPDICVDVPEAYPLLERLGNKLYACSVLTDDLMNEMPTRGRKRFVSEGDGGKIKDPTLR